MPYGRQRSAEAIERGDGVTLRRGTDLIVDLVAGKRHIVPGARRLLPKGRWIGLHEVGPVRRLGHRLGAKDALHGRARLAAQVRVGDLANNTVTGFAPGECRGGRDGKDGSRYGDEDAHTWSLPR